MTQARLSGRRWMDGLTSSLTHTHTKTSQGSSRPGVLTLVSQVPVNCGDSRSMTIIPPHRQTQRPPIPSPLCHFHSSLSSSLSSSVSHHIPADLPFLHSYPSICMSPFSLIASLSSLSSEHLSSPLLSSSLLSSRAVLVNYKLVLGFWRRKKKGASPAFFNFTPSLLLVLPLALSSKKVWVIRWHPECLWQIRIPGCRRL